MNNFLFMAIVYNGNNDNDLMMIMINAILSNIVLIEQTKKLF